VIVGEIRAWLNSDPLLTVDVAWKYTPHSAIVIPTGGTPKRNSQENSAGVGKYAAA
jgi:hypothetical protein